MVKKHLGTTFEKAGLKKTALRVYFFFINTWSEIDYFFRKLILPRLAHYRSRKGVYAIDLDSDWLGLGARIVKTLELLLYCEEKGLNPLIRYSYREKTGKEPDYFGELFSFRLADKMLSSSARFTHVRDLEELCWKEDYNNKLRLAMAQPLFNKYLTFNHEILEEAGLFCSNHFKDQKILGVHYRGTDKVGEAPLVSREQLLGCIKEVLAENPGLEVVFVSADDQKIVSFLQTSDLPVPVICREDAVRSNDGDQFHRKKEISKSIVNRDAIVNMLLLSRCHFLLKTASILSDCSVIFNPAMEIRVISFPHSNRLTWWPATEIKRNQEAKTHAVASK